ncbi:gamma-glutamyltransferase [Thiothrix nivea]|uniref:Glutathione hydrolase proenzyme n=1 Tax=Thiothrix nivea (strain ATCC 35100 / DSM 5205 / JP2) TaxID=870187 RepID=A0A656H8Q8_THINJ|nr:gamma-glutamyltransferase [Thiothrix nivea]EIJ33031.1 gamma-glutamyltransferase 1 [Thiothrix nivea DSM 5205]
MKYLLAIILWAIVPTAAWAADAGIATAHPLATTAAKETLAKGGNAFDAAITAAAALAVVELYGSGLGGGGFWLLHRAEDGFETMLDGRETAPAAATRDMYLDTTGEPIPNASLEGPLAAGIPGVPAALDYLASHYGKLPLRESLAPAIQLAREGFPVDKAMRRHLAFRQELLRKYPETSRILLPAGKLPDIGDTIRQPELAQTLELLAEKGRAGFYAGEFAEQMVAAVKAAGGIWSLDDLKNYRVKEREPIRGEYHGIKVTTAAPPSSGGIVLLEMLNMLSAYDLPKAAAAQRTHWQVETMRRAYRDRAEYLGDPDFVAIPTQRLLGADHAARLRASIQDDKATPSADLKPVAPGVSGRGMNTTHFSILDKDGNRVAATLSINYPFGSGFMPKGSGVLLNNEMDDFSIRPGTPNVYGLVGAEANAIEPGKRMLSSMTPTFLEDGKRIAILGTPGGSRIITMLLLGTQAFANGENASRIVNRRRFHHQYLPDSIQYEPEALDADTLFELESMGHSLSPQDDAWGNMQAVILDKQTGTVDAASDGRGIGQAATVAY